MKKPAFYLALALPMLALAACGGGDTAGNASAPAAPVAAAPAPAGKSWLETVVKTAEGGHRIGNPDAPIKLVEYGSRTCPTCGAFAREGTQPLLEKYVASGKVSFEFRDFLVHGAPDMAAALVGICGGEAVFFPLLEQMYASQSDYLDRLQAMPEAMQAELASAKPTVVATRLAEQMNFIEFAKQRGLPEAKVRACLNDQAALEALAKTHDTASASGQVRGTPTFILNGKVVENAVAWPAVEAALKAAGA